MSYIIDNIKASRIKYILGRLIKPFSTLFLFSIIIINPAYGNCPPPGPCLGYIVSSEVSSGKGPLISSIDSMKTQIEQAVNQANCGSTSCSTNTQQHSDDDAKATYDELTTWLRDNFWYDGTKGIGPSLRHMATQITTTNMAATGIIGTFFDAQAHIDGQRLINKLHADAHNKYQPSRALCRFGTNVRSLAATEELSEPTKYMIARRSIERQMGNSISMAAEGGKQDKKARMEKFRKYYCDHADNMGLLGAACEAPINNDRLNKDINFTKTLYSPSTLDIDFSDGTSSADEEDILSLANNLYAHNIFTRLSKTKLEYTDNREVFLDARSVMAKRSVAESSFNNLAAAKTKGTAQSAQYLKKIISELGIASETEINKLIGTNPSYYAQMEVLTKKLYQNPNFYIGLIDKPTNIDRQNAAMKSFELMQQRDIYESLLRSEAILSVLVETKLRKMHTEAEDELLSIK